MKKVILLCVVDIGNTRTKFGVWRRPSDAFDQFSINAAALNAVVPDVEFVDNSNTYESTSLRFQEPWLRDSGEIFWVISSVNPGKTEALIALVRSHRPNDLFKILSLADIPLQVEYDCPEKLGMDRAIAAFAGIRLLGRGVPLLVIDAGTATTVDYVDSANVFRGGAILPGPRLMAESLQYKTASLPMLDDPENQNYVQSEWEQWNKVLQYPATETQKGIRLGVVFTLTGAIAAFYWKIYKRILEENGDPSRLTALLSGGSAELTSRRLSGYFDELGACLGIDVPCPHIDVEPRLVLLGLFEIARLNRSAWRL